jgi:hypothetical protein
MNAESAWREYKKTSDYVAMKHLALAPASSQLRRDENVELALFEAFKAGFEARGA